MKVCRPADLLVDVGGRGTARSTTKNNYRELHIAITANTVAESAGCPRCRQAMPAEAEFCPHCMARIGEHRRVPWWHVHRRVYDWTIGWAYRPSASYALFALAFAESSFFPVPPDVLLIALSLGNRKKWFRYALMCSIASVLGGIAGYAIGMFLWTAIEAHVYQWLSWTGLTPQAFAGIKATYEQWNFWIVFAAGFTPIPYKLITISGGLFGINFPIFVVASAISRSARFFLVAGMMRLSGPKIAPFIEKYFNWLALAFTALLIGGFMAMKYLF